MPYTIDSNPGTKQVNKEKDEERGGSGLLAAAALFAVFTLVFFRPLIFNPGGMIYSPLSDLVGQTFGWKLLIRDTLWSSGNLALWNPHLMCGNPILGNLNYALFFPMHLLYLLLPVGPAASWTYLLTHFLGGLAAWYYLRTVGIRNWGAILGGLAFGFGVRNLGHLANGFVGHLETLPFLPLAFAFTARLADRRTWIHAAALALTLAVILFSAFAQIFLYLMFILPLYLAWLLFSDRGRGRDGGGTWWLPAVQFTIAVVLAGGLAAVHLLPAVQLLPEISRSTELSPELYRLGSLPLRHFFTLVNPELLGRIVPQWSYFGSAYFWTLAFYTPILMLPLAFLSFCDPAGRRHRNFFLILIPAIFLFSMGTYGPVYDFCHRFIPGVRLFREPARILFFLPLAMAVLAGFGWNALQRIAVQSGSAERRRATLLVSAAALLVLLLAAGYGVYLNDGAQEAITVSFETSATFFSSHSRGIALQVAEYRVSLERLLTRTMPASLLFFASSLGLIITVLKRGHTMSSDTLKGLALLILVADLLFFGRGYLKTVDSRKLFLKPNPLVQQLTDLQAVEPPFRVVDLSGALTDNMACAAGIDKVGGYDPINLLGTQRYFDAINGREDQNSTAWTLRVEPGFRRELLDLLNARYLLTRQSMDGHQGLELVASFEPLPVTLQNFGQVAIPGVRLYRNTRAAPRAWFVARAVPLDPGRSLAEQLEQIDPAGVVLLENGEHTFGADPKPVNGYREAEVRMTGPGGLEVEGEFPGPGWLVISQAWSGGWTAEDAKSGLTMPVLRANGMLTAVLVEGAGRQRIRLNYCPPGLNAGMALSTLSLLGVVAMAFAGRRFRWPPAKSAKGRPIEEKSQSDEHQLVDKGDWVRPQEVKQEEQVEGDGQGIEDA